LIKFYNLIKQIDMLSSNTTKLSPSANATLRQSHFSTTPLMRMNAPVIGATGKSGIANSQKSFKPATSASVGRPANQKL
jgi:hypothetical protein